MKGCAPRVEGALSKASGVEECKVDFNSKTAVVKVKAGTDPKDVANALEGTRYSAKMK